MNRTRVLALLVALQLPMASVFAVPTLFNSTSDFSKTDNPNGPWSYRYAPDGTSNEDSRLFNAYLDDPVDAWFIPSEPPSVQFTLVGIRPLIPSTFMHPGNDKDVLIGFELLASFTPGLVPLHINVRDGNNDGDGQVLTVWKNENILSMQTLDPIFNPFGFDLNVPMDVGDIVYIRLNRNGAFFFDSVHVDATFEVDVPATEAPEPSFLLLLLAGLVALAARSRAR